MSFFRSRVKVAVIGLLLVGGISAALMFLMTSQPTQAALIAAGQVGATTPTTSTGATTATATATIAPARPATATPRPIPTAPSTSPGGELVGRQGTVSSIDTNTNSFVITTASGASITIVVTSSTTYQGSARRLSDLRQGWQVEVQGMPQSNGNFQAAMVNADSGN